MAVAVWDAATANPWATIPTDVLIDRGLASRPVPGMPGMFALAAPGGLAELLEAAGFVEVVVEPVAIERRYESAEQFVEELLNLSAAFREPYGKADRGAREAISGEIEARLEPFRDVAGGGYLIPGSSLGAAGSA